MRRASYAVLVIALFSLIVPLAARTVEPYHHLAVLLGIAGIVLLALALLHRRGLFAIGVIATTGSYALSTVSRSGVDPMLPVAAALIAGGLGCAHLFFSAFVRGDEQARRFFPPIVLASIAAAAIAALVEVAGRAHGPSGLPAELTALVAVAALPALFWLRQRGSARPD